MALSFKKIGVQILALVTLLILFQVLISVMAYFSIKSISQNLDVVFSKRLPSIDNLVQADRDFQQALVAERTLLLIGLDKDLYEKQAKDYLVNRKQVIDRFNVYRSLGPGPKELEIIDTFVNEYEQWIKYSDEYLLFLKPEFVGNRDEYINKSLVDASKFFEGARDVLDQLQEIILARAEDEYKASQSTYQDTVREVVITLVGSIVFSLILSFFIVKMVTRKIKGAIELIENKTVELNGISTNLEDKSTELSSIAQEQSSSVEETSSSLHEISQMVKKNTEIAVTSADMVTTGRNQLGSGIDLIFKLAQRIKEVNGATEELVKSVDENHERLSNILNVFTEIQTKTGVINDIVFQTKLLSFNASVEAARAGEHGKGFSVVAEEIGGLAKQSGDSANEISTELDKSFGNISGIIGRSKEEVFKAVEKNKGLIGECLSLSQECEVVLKQMGSMFENIATSSHEIATASQEQNSGVEEINTAVQEISDSNQITAQRSNEVENLARSINSVSELLQTSIKELNDIV